MRTLAIVVPAFNEERRLPGLFAALKEAAAGFEQMGLRLEEIIVVDDGSSDRTPAILREARNDLRALRPLLGDGVNRGKGAAVASGLHNTRSDLVLIADVDVATPFEELDRLLDRIDRGADIAIGSRDSPDSNVEEAPRHRVILGRTFNRITRAMTGLEIRDTQCGFKLLRTDAARALTGDQIVSGFAYDVELLMRARAAGLVIAEVGVRYRHGLHSTVRPLRHAPRMLYDITRLAFGLRLRARRRPRPASG